VRELTQHDRSGQQVVAVALRHKEKAFGVLS